MNAPIEATNRMVAEWRIRDVIGRYARGVDRRDGTLIGKCFHAGALMHYGDFDGDIAGFVPWVLDYLTVYSRTMHFMGTSIIDWPEDGRSDHVGAETYAIVAHEKTEDTPGRSWIGWIRYLDHLALRGGQAGADAEWRIVERTVVGDLLRIDPAENVRDGQTCIPRRAG